MTSNAGASPIMQRRPTFAGPHSAGLFAAVAAVLAAGYSGASAAPQSNVFTVGNYPVEAHADDAVAAKKAAITQGQSAALRSLLKRLVPVTVYPRLRRVSLTNTDAFIDGISVRSERNSTTDYIASLDFAFRPDSIRALLQRENLPFVETQAPAITIVPVVLGGTQAVDGVDSNAWRAAWSGLDLSHALTPLKLEPIKPGVHPDTIAALAKGDTTMLRTFAGEYGGEERLVAAIVQPDATNHKLRVTLVGRDSVASIAWTQAYRFQDSDPGYALEMAAIVSLGVLEGRWKATGARVQGPIREPGDVDAPPPNSAYPAAQTDQAQRPMGTGELLQLSVQFRDIGEWATISKRLSQMPGVDNIDVAGLSGRSARITLQYAGGAERLAQAAPQYGLQIRQSASGYMLTVQ